MKLANHLLPCVQAWGLAGKHATIVCTALRDEVTRHQAESQLLCSC